MLLKQATVQNFRNIPQASLKFIGRRQFFLGPNGQGKTNLLEALGYVTALRSFRTGDHRLLVKAGESQAAVGLVVEHDVMGETRVRIGIRPDGRQVAVDEERVIRLADIIGKFPAVVFSSDDVQFIRASPGLRRRWMDLLFAAADPEYLQVLQQYHRALQGRNRLLKRESPEGEIGAFEAAMAPVAVEVYRKRMAAVSRIAALVSDQYALISGGSEEAGLRLRADLGAYSQEDYVESWRKNRPRDVFAGSTQRGPHRDDFILELDGRLARDYASEGQQRGMMLALRLAQVVYFRETLRVAPILLADDIVNELDPVRRERFWRAIGEESQLIATGTSMPGGDGWQVFEVENGTFREI